MAAFVPRSSMAELCLGASWCRCSSRFSHVSCWCLMKRLWGPPGHAPMNSLAGSAWGFTQTGTLSGDMLYVQQNRVWVRKISDFSRYMLVLSYFQDTWPSLQGPGTGIKMVVECWYSVERQNEALTSVSTLHLDFKNASEIITAVTIKAPLTEVSNWVLKWIGHYCSGLRIISSLLWVFSTNQKTNK